MSIRLRWVGCQRVALCAVESDPMPGDTYLDQCDHEALGAKFLRDWRAEGMIPGGPMPADPAHESQRVRDDDEVMARWREEAAQIGREVCAMVPPELAERFRRFYEAPE